MKNIFQTGQKRHQKNRGPHSSKPNKNTEENTRENTREATKSFQRGVLKKTRAEMKSATSMN